MRWGWQVSPTSLCRLEDSEGETVEDTFRVTVNEAQNSAPTVANPIADVTLQSGSNPAVMNISDVFIDAEDDDSSLVITDFRQ